MNTIKVPTDGGQFFDPVTISTGIICNGEAISRRTSKKMEKLLFRANMTLAIYHPEGAPPELMLVPLDLLPTVQKSGSLGPLQQAITRELERGSA